MDLKHMGLLVGMDLPELPLVLVPGLALVAALAVLGLVISTC